MHVRSSTIVVESDNHKQLSNDEIIFWISHAHVGMVFFATWFIKGDAHSDPSSLHTWMGKIISKNDLNDGTACVEYQFNHRPGFHPNIVWQKLARLPPLLTDSGEIVAIHSLLQLPSPERQLELLAEEQEFTLHSLKSL